MSQRINNLLVFLILFFEVLSNNYQNSVINYNFNLISGEAKENSGSTESKFISISRVNREQARDST